MKRQFLGVLLLLTVLLSITQYAEAKIPPTAAIQMINGTGGNVTAGNYKDFITFAEGTGIALSWDYTLHKITFATNGAGNPIENYCTGTDKFYAYNSTTHLFLCASDQTGSGSSGQNNTASSSGVGYSLVLPKVGVDLPFKGLWVTGDLSISQNATDITFSHIAQSIYENNTMSSPTHANSLILTKSGVDLPIKGIACSGSITCSNNNTDVTLTYTAMGGGNMSSLNDGGDVTITSPSPLSVLYYVGSQWIDKIFSINTKLATNGNFVTGINNQTGIITTQTFKVNNQTINGGDTFIQGINNATGVITKKQFSINTISDPPDTFVTSINNQTGQITVNQFSVNTQSCGVGTMISAINNATGQVTCTTVTASGGATSLGANVTTALFGKGQYVSVFGNIALTQNSGNTISGVMVASSNTAGVAPQFGMNTTNVGSKGICKFTTPISINTESIDNLRVNGTNGNIVDTAETTLFPPVNQPMPVIFECTINTGATPGNARMWMQGELAGTMKVSAGSYYIKTP